MARTYPYWLPYRTCLGRLEDPLQLLQHLYRGPLQWPESICQAYTTDYQRAAQDDGPQFPLLLARPSDPSRSPTNAGLSQDSALVAPAQGWKFSPCFRRYSLLPRTPGTACGLARG